MVLHEAPIFVVGCPRSGTTLMQAKISALDRIAIPPEDDFILRFYEYEDGEFNNQLDSKRVAFLLDDLFNHDGGTFKNWLVSRATIEQILRDQNVTLKELICIIYKAFLHRFTNKTRWGCKVPYFAKHIKVLARIFPDAKFVHMVRDPRAVYQSMNDRRSKGATHFPKDAASAAYLWRRLVSQAELDSKDVAYLKVFYEKLIQGEHVMQELAEFLGEKFSEENQDFYQNLKRQELIRLDNIDQYVKPEMDRESAQRWKVELSQAEIAEIEEIAEKQMLLQGYDRSPFALPIAVRLQCSFKKVLFWLNDHVRPRLKRVS